MSECKTGSCGKRKTPPPILKEFGLRYSEGKSVQTKFGAKCRTCPLVTQRPTRGWEVAITIDDHELVAEGNSAKEVFHNAKTYFRLNDITISDQDIWLNLNADWLDRSALRHSLVEREKLLLLTNLKPEGRELSNNPMRYGAKIWSSAQVYLSGEWYDEDIFRGWIDLAMAVLQDPLIGCPVCEDHFKKSLEEANLTTRETARVWLWATMNAIRNNQGRPTMTLDKAAEKHEWYQQLGIPKLTDSNEEE